MENIQLFLQGYADQFGIPLYEPTVDVENAKIERWKRKRTGKITASILPSLMLKGRGKNEEWGKTAIKELYLTKYERRTGLTRNNTDAPQFRWGHENEPKAIDWLKRNLGLPVKSCNTDFDDIIFREPFAGFGDSPDFFVYDNDGNEIGVGEIKCPVDQGKIEELNELTEITPDCEYFYQFIGHLIASPGLMLYWLIYDAYSDQGHLLTMCPSDYTLDVEITTRRIRQANFYIDFCMKHNLSISQINSFTQWQE